MQGMIPLIKCERNRERSNNRVYHLLSCLSDKDAHEEPVSSVQVLRSKLRSRMDV